MPQLTFDEDTEAVALFFKTEHGEKHFRLVVWRKHWEFSDGGWIGPDPVGVVRFNSPYFNTYDKLDRYGYTSSRYYVEQFTEHDERRVRIKFFDPHDPDTQFAEFTANDPFNRSGENGILDTYLSANWRKVTYTNHVAYAHKKKGTATTSITAAYYKKAKVQLPDIQGDEFCVEGNLVVKDHHDDGQHVLWSQDRCVFLKDRPSVAKDFTAFFFPIYDKATIGSKDEMSVENGVTWEKHDDEAECV